MIAYGDGVVVVVVAVQQILAVTVKLTVLGVNEFNKSIIDIVTVYIFMVSDIVTSLLSNICT